MPRSDRGPKRRKKKQSKESIRIRALADSLDENGGSDEIQRDLRRAAEIIENRFPILDREVLLYIRYKTTLWFSVGMLVGIATTILCVVLLK